MRMELRRLALALAAGWLAVGAATYVVAFFFAQIDDSDVFMPPIRWTLLALFSRAALIPVFIALMHRYPIRRDRIVRGLLLHTLFCLGLAALHFGFYIAIRLAFENLSVPHRVHIASTFVKYAVINYAAVGTAMVVVHQQRLARLTTLTRTRLERRLASAHLERELLSVDAEGIVRSLEDIERRIERDPAEAERMIAGLSNQLRRKLLQSDVHSSGKFAVVPEAPAWSRHPVTVMAFMVYPISAFCWVALTIAQYWINPGPTNWPYVAGVSLGFAAAAATWPLIVIAIRKFQRAGADWRHSMFVAGACSLASALTAELVITMFRGSAIVIEAGHTLGPALFVSFIAANHLQSAHYGEWHASEQLRTQNVLRDVKQAQLRTLRKQLAPHFLFNALNSILCLLETDVPASHTMLVKLRRVLQLTFWHHSREEVTLRKDLELTSSYLEIERVRFRDALDLSLDVDRTLLSAAVPSFLLQPLVENAVHHGALSSRGRGTITVRVQRAGGDMEIRVENDCDLIESHEYREGIGLANIRQRLHHLYGDDQQLAVDGHGRGFSVRIRLPIRTLADAA